MADDDGEFMLVVGHRGKRTQCIKTGAKSVEALFKQGAERTEAELRAGPLVATKDKLTPHKATETVRQLAKSEDIRRLAAPARAAVSEIPGFSPSGGKFKLRCLGLGSPTNSSTARHQLAFLVAFARLLRKSVEKVELFDPVFTEFDELILRRDFQFEVTHDNLEGKEQVGDRVVYFMPHCCRSLFANLLRTNWSAERLSNVIIIGNDFASFVLNAIGPDMKRSTEAIKRVKPFTRAAPLGQYYPDCGAFSETSVQWFPAEGTQGAATFDSLPPAPIPDHELARRKA